VVLVVPLLSWREVALNSRNLWLQSTTRGCPTLQTWAQNATRCTTPHGLFVPPVILSFPSLRPSISPQLGLFSPSLPFSFFLSFFLLFFCLVGFQLQIPFSRASVCTHRNARGGLCWCDCTQHTHLSNRDSHVLCAYTGHVQM